MLSLDSQLLASFRVTVAEPTRREPVVPESLALESTTIPLLDSEPLAEMVGPGSSVVIAFTDGTRPSPDHLLVGLLRTELERAGVAPGDITLLCATGLHRPMTDRELLAKLGSDGLRGTTVVNHNALDTEGQVRLGTIDGIPVEVNRLCAEADLLLAVGIVEPHQYAGFSGGAKTVVIGCGGEATIRGTHGLEMIEQTGTRLGRTEGNPFQEFVGRAGRMIGLRYVLNVVLDGEGEIIATACGDPSSVHSHLSLEAAKSCGVDVPGDVHIAVTGVPESKGVNLYQASRAATYLALTEGTPLLPEAPIVLPARIPEGAGAGTGEGRFFRMLSEASSPAELVARLRREGFPAGAQRAFILAQVLENHPVIVAGAERPDVVRACHMIHATDTASALEMGLETVKRTFGHALTGKAPHLLIVPNGLTTLVRRPGTS